MSVFRQCIARHRLHLVHHRDRSSSLRQDTASNHPLLFKVWCGIVVFLLIVGVTPLEITDDRLFWGLLFPAVYGALYLCHRALHSEPLEGAVFAVVAVVEAIVGLGVFVISVIVLGVIVIDTHHGPTSECIRYRLRSDPGTTVATRIYDMGGWGGARFETVRTFQLVGPLSYTIALTDSEEKAIARSSEWVRCDGPECGDCEDR